MIQDDGKLLIAVVPADGIYASSTFGIDLNPDFGQGVSARKSPLPGMGEGILLRVDVIIAFAIGAGEPVCQFHAVLSNVANDVTTVLSGTSVLSIGVQAPTQVNDAGEFVQGLVAADLVLNNHFFIRMNPWTAGMGRNLANATVIGKDHRFLGLAVAVPNYEAATHFFSAGAVTATLVKSGDVMQNPSDHTYPSAVLNVG